MGHEDETFKLNRKNLASNAAINADPVNIVSYENR